jgi:hypothetical protein
MSPHTFADICVGIASACYLAAGIGYLAAHLYPLGVAYFCWATANGCLILVAQMKALGK